MDLKQDLKFLFNWSLNVYLRVGRKWIFFAMESIFGGESWPAEPPIDVVELRQKAVSVLLRTTYSRHVDVALQGALGMASSHVAASRSADAIFHYESESQEASSSSQAPRACGEASLV